MQPAAPAPCRAGGYGPPGLEKNEALTARVLSFLGWESALFGCAGARRAGGCGPGNGKIAANEKRGRRRGPVPQWDMRGLAAAACRPPNPRKTKHWQPAFLAFWDGKRLVWLRRSHVAQAAADREMTKMAANEKRGHRRIPSRSGMCAAWARQLAAQTAASKGRGFFFHGRKFGRGVESLFHF